MEKPAKNLKKVLQKYKIYDNLKEPLEKGLLIVL